MQGLTTGVKNALARHDHHSLCGCGFALPKYPGRYPKNCPSCGEPRTTSEAVGELRLGNSTVQIPESVEAGATFTLGDVSYTVVEVAEGVVYVEDDAGAIQEVPLR